MHEELGWPRTILKGGKVQSKMVTNCKIVLGNYENVEVIDIVVACRGGSGPATRVPS